MTGASFLDRSGADRLAFECPPSAYDDWAAGWLAALDLRDPGARGHARRVTALALRLARRMDYRQFDLGQLRLGALLHDLGKLMVPDHVLHNPGALSEAASALIRQHPGHGRRLLAPLTDCELARDVVYAHHEKWNGSGYPLGLDGGRIPWAARLVALADVWDALRSDRPYRPAWSLPRACRYVAEQAGHHFDPAVVDVFLSLVG